MEDFFLDFFIEDLREWLSISIVSEEEEDVSSMSSLSDTSDRSYIEFVIVDDEEEEEDDDDDDEIFSFDKKSKDVLSWIKFAALECSCRLCSWLLNFIGDSSIFRCCSSCTLSLLSSLMLVESMNRSCMSDSFAVMDSSLSIDVCLLKAGLIYFSTVENSTSTITSVDFAKNNNTE